jgi:hypothetical protein
MNATKVFIVVLIVMAVVFAGGMVLGATRTDKPVSLDTLEKQWGALRDRLAHPEPLRIQDLTASSGGCIIQNTHLLVVRGGECQFSIHCESCPVVRKLGLYLVEGSAATVSLDQPIGGGNVTQTKALPVADLAADKDWDVYKEGGTLRVVCKNIGLAPACKLQLK